MNSEIFNLEKQLENVKKKYLADNGWTYTCDVPGSFWLWQKKLSDGRTILVSLEDALKIEEHIPKAVTPKA